MPGQWCHFKQWLLALESALCLPRKHSPFRLLIASRHAVCVCEVMVVVVVAMEGEVIQFQSVVKLAEGSRGWKHTIIGASRADGDRQGGGNIFKKW